MSPVVGNSGRVSRGANRTILPNNSAQPLAVGVNVERPIRRQRQKCRECGREGHNRLTCPMRQQSGGNGGVVPPANENVQVVRCECCRRASSGDYNLSLRVLDIPHTNRRFGKTRLLRQGSNICKLCYAYVDKNNKYPKWSHAWPSVLYSCLTKQGMVTNMRAVLNFFPDILKVMYRAGCESDILQGFKDIWNVEESKFIDITIKRKTFLDTIFKCEELGVMTNAVDETPYPDIKCPMGCNIYFDEKVGEGLTYLPAHHYLSQFLKNFTNFDASVKHIVGFRPDFPIVLKELKWTVQPALIRDRDKGLCIVMCGTKHHSDARFTYVHVPRHPVQKIATLHPDFCSPCAVMPYFVRAGRTNSKTADYATVRMQASGGGLSTFGLIPQSPFFLSDMIHPTRIDEVAWGFTLTMRPDIRESIANMSQFAQRYRFIDWVMALYSNYEDKYKELVEEAAKSGTYVRLSDAVRMHKGNFLGGKLSNDNAENKVIQVVHPCDGCGKSAYIVPRFMTKGQNNGDQLCVMHVLISTLLHCQPLQHYFIKHMCDNSENAALKKLYDFIAHVAYFKTTKYTKKTYLEVETALIDKAKAQNTELNDNASTEAIVAGVLKNISGIDVINLQPGEEIDANLFEGHTNIVLVNGEGAGVPYQVPHFIEEFNLQLLFAFGIIRHENRSSDVHVLHRWSDDHCFVSQVNGGKQHESNVIEDFQYTVFIYASHAMTTSLSEDVVLPISGTQTKLRCGVHPTSFLGEVLTSDFKCCHEQCSTVLHWRCPYGLGTGEQCTTGLCRKHARQLLKGKDPYYALPQNRDDHGPVTRDDNVIQEDIFDISESGEEGDVESDGDDRAVIGDLIDSGPAILTSRARRVYMDEEGLTGMTSSHFLINQGLRCNTRLACQRSSSAPLNFILQHIKSVSNDSTYPLLHPEGLLFPAIFWHLKNGAPAGAIPAPLFGPLGKREMPGGFAKLISQLRVRLRDQSLLTARAQHYIAFAFDVILNSDLSNQCISVAIKKGLHNIHHTWVEPEAREHKLGYDELDSNMKLRELRNMVAEIPWDLFLTITCNDSGTFGVRKIREAIIEAGNYDDDETDRRMQENASIILRAWERSVRHFFDYIVNSPSKPFGDVIQYWLRFEFQGDGSPGNKPHVHAGLTVNRETYDEEAVNKAVMNKIQYCFTEGYSTDYETLKRYNLVESRLEYVNLDKEMEDLQTHFCSRSKGKCQKRTRDGKFKCRVPRHDPSFTYSVRKSHCYSYEGLQNLYAINCAAKYKDGTIVPDDFLMTKRYSYPTDPPIRKNGEVGVSVPCNPQVFVAFRSVSNIQRCDSRTIGYVTKYASGPETGPSATIVTKDKQINTVQVEREPITNEKLDVSNVAEKEATQKKNASYCREIGQAEMIWNNLGMDYTRTNVKFEHPSTYEPEMRCAVKRTQSGYVTKIVDENGDLKPVAARKDFPPGRVFTENQEILMLDYAKGIYHMDQTSAFSIRPPELLIVSSVKEYLKWFIRGENVKEYTAKEDICECPWIDGTCKRVLLRKRYINELAEYIEKKTKSRNEDERYRAHMLSLVIDSIQEENNRRTRNYSALYMRFVAVDETQDVVVAFTHITPENFKRFCYHLLITMGNFETELDFNGKSLKQSLIDAGVADGATARDNIIIVASRYLKEQLVHSPKRTKEQERLLGLVISGLSSLFCDEDVVVDATPLVTQRAILEAASEQLAKFETNILNNLISGLANFGVSGVSADDWNKLREQKQISFRPVARRILGQSLASHEEQQKVLKVGKRSIDNLSSPYCTSPLFPIICGPPGAGKTFLLMILCTYALARGLRTALVSYTSERARQLGETHIHLLFDIPITQSSLESVGVMVDRCVTHLKTFGQTKLAFLKRLDILFFEEIRLLSGRMFNIIDNVLRNIRKQPHRPFGGVLLVASGDHRQLTPVDGCGIWTHSQLAHQFAFLELKRLVRSRTDRDMQKVIETVRNVAPTSTEIENVIDTMKRRMYPQNFLNKWEDVNDKTLRVVGKRRAEARVTKTFLEEKKKQVDVQYVTCKSLDEVETGRNQWMVAKESTSIALNKKCGEQRELVLFKGSIMRLTYNNMSGRHPFSQGQFIIIQTLPDPQKPLSEQFLTGRLVPSGERDVDPDNIPHSWPLITIRRRYSAIVTLNRSLKVRRYQFPLRYFVCSTIHKVIGETLPRIATQISCTDESFKLWEREQLLVLLSRVPTLLRFYFIGSPKDISDNEGTLK